MLRYVILYLVYVVNVMNKLFPKGGLIWVSARALKSGKVERV